MILKPDFDNNNMMPIEMTAQIPIVGCLAATRRRDSDSENQKR